MCLLWVLVPGALHAHHTFTTEAAGDVQDSKERLGLLWLSFESSSLESDGGFSGHLKKNRKAHIYNSECNGGSHLGPPTPRRENQEDGCKFKGSLSYREEKIAGCSESTGIDRQIFYEFKAILVYIEWSMIARAM